MALENFGGIRSISVPTWLKLLIFLIVLAALAADLAIALDCPDKPAAPRLVLRLDATRGFAASLAAFHSAPGIFQPRSGGYSTKNLASASSPGARHHRMLSHLESRVRLHREGAVGKGAPRKHAHRNRPPAGRFLLHLQDFVPGASLHASENAGRLSGRRAQGAPGEYAPVRTT